MPFGPDVLDPDHPARKAMQAATRSYTTSLGFWPMTSEDLYIGDLPPVLSTDPSIVELILQYRDAWFAEEKRLAVQYWETYLHGETLLVVKMPPPPPPPGPVFAAALRGLL